MYTVQELQKDWCESCLRCSDLISTICEPVPKGKPFFFDQQFEAINGSIVMVQHEFC